MRLRDLRRTSGFHVALLFFATFGMASLSLFGFLYIKTRIYGRTAAYEWVRWESARLSRLPPESLRERTQASDDFEQGGRPLVVFDGTGKRLAGADIPFPRDAPVGKPFRLDQTTNGKSLVFFSMLNPLPSGNFLLVSRSAKDLQALEEGLIEVFAWGIAGTIAIGLIGAVFFGVGSLRQIEAVTSSAQQIMRGDLSGRLPTRGLSADLENLTCVVNDMLDQLERLMVEVKSVNENIAHDLRTPLTRVMASLERSARHSKTVDEFRAVNEDVILEIKTIVVRFSALLRISELEDRLRRSGFAEVDLREILSDAVDYYEPPASERNITLVWTRPSAPCLIDGDASLLFEAASNLIDNAIKFSPSGSTVVVSATRDPAGFVVADSGCGISSAELSRVRSRFERGAARRTQSGFGIGLSLVDSIARLHGMAFDITDNGPGCRARLRVAENAGLTPPPAV